MKMRHIAILCLALGAGGAGAVVYKAVASGGAAMRTTEQEAVSSAGLVDRVEKHLAPGYTADGDTLLAAAPTDPAKFRDPQQIVLAHLGTEDPDSKDSAGVDWQAVEKQISTATGRPVVDATYDSSPQQLDGLREGRMTLIALHAADTPFLVNQYGFHPVAVLGESGKGANGNRLDVIVPAGSSIQTLGELRGHNVAFTLPSSITGYRAGIVLLMDKQQLRPNVDYQIIWSLKQKTSIAGVAAGQYEAACVSDDKLRSMVEKGQVKPSSYRVIYTSDVVPRTTIGYFSDLRPELAAKIAAALTAYKPADADDFSFLPVDYKRDFALVRQIDDRFDPRLDTKIKAHAGPTTAPAT
jgi:phosphonate transport system substrate-binding protein